MSKVARRFPPSLVDGSESEETGQESSVARRDKVKKRSVDGGIREFGGSSAAESSQPCPRSSTIHEIVFGRSSRYGKHRVESRRSPLHRTSTDRGEKLVISVTVVFTLGVSKCSSSVSFLSPASVYRS